MPSLWEEEFEPDVFWLPKLLDCVDFENPSEIETSINTLFTGITTPDGFGDKTEFWRFIQNNYGEHRVMWNYTAQYPNPENVFGRVRRCNPDLTRINKGLISVFNANNIKYKRLISSLNADYNPLEPYNVEEEHSEGNKSSKTSMMYAQHTDTTNESSMDDTTNLYPASSVSYGTHTDTVDREHNQKTSFKGSDFEPNSDETHHRKDYRHGNIGNQTQADLIEKEILLTRYNFWDIVSKDITDMVCLKIFMSC